MSSLQVFIDHASVYKYLYDKNAKDLRFKSNTFITIPLMILNSISSALSFTDIEWIDIPVGCINLSCVILLGLREIYQFSEKSELNRDAYKKWNKFAVEILAHHRGEVTNEIITISKNRYIELIDESPQIAEHIISSYRKHVLEKVTRDINVPDIVDGVPSDLSVPPV